jgi:hypothetical protein
MRFFQFLCLALLPLLAWAQHDELHYFSDAANPKLLGVKNKAGKVIIPAAYTSPYAKAGDVIATDQILLRDAVKAKPDAMHFDYGVKVFDRNGHFLYSPYWADHAPQPYHEGLRQFVENGKMGFVDINGKKVIPAKYPVVNNFFDGCAYACIGCTYRGVRNNEVDGQPIYNSGKWVIINRQGKVVKKLSDDFDWQFGDSLLRAYHLVRKFDSVDVNLLLEASVATGQSDKIAKHKPMTMVIAQRPGPGNEYYMIDYRGADGWADDDACYLVSKDRSNFCELSMKNGVLAKRWFKNPIVKNR